MAHVDAIALARFQGKEFGNCVRLLLFDYLYRACWWFLLVCFTVQVTALRAVFDLYGSCWLVIIPDNG